MLILGLLACQEHILSPLKDDNGLGDPKILVEPASLSFGPVTTGCVQEALVTVANVGEGPLDVSRAWFEGDAGLTVADADFSLPPGGETTLLVTYDGPEGEIGAELYIESDDPLDSLVVVPATGLALDGNAHSDTFFQDPDPIDVLWVIDNSSSMWEEQERLIAEINGYLSRFVAYDIDFHMGVITTDPDEGGALHGDIPFVMRDTPDAEDELARAMEVGTGFTGYEKGLYTAELALSEPALSGPNAGFYREEARLGLVFVSDEPDYSSYDADHFIEFFSGLKGGATKVLAAAVVGDRGTGCDTSCGSTDYGGDKYLDVVDAFGGSAESVCDCDLGPFLDAIGLQTTDYARRFALSQIPQEDHQMQVFLDGEEQIGNWSFDATTNSVWFDMAPPSGSDVEIRYLLPVGCE